jgi:hypothetical protein
VTVIPRPKNQAEKPVAGDKGTGLLCPQRNDAVFAGAKALTSLLLTLPKKTGACGPSFAEPSQEEIAISAFIGDKEKHRTRWRLPSRNFHCLRNAKLDLRSAA